MGDARDAQDVQSRQGVIAACIKGTIQQEMERHSRRLTNIHWDNGYTLNVSPNEIIDGDLLWQ